MQDNPKYCVLVPKCVETNIWKLFPNIHMSDVLKRKHTSSLDLSIMPADILFKITDYIRDIEYTEDICKDILEIRQYIIKVFECSPYNISDKTTKILREIMYDKIDERNACEFFQKDWKKEALTKD